MNQPTEETNAQVAQINVAGKTQVGGLDYKTAGWLCYLPVCAVNLIASLVFFTSEPKDNYFVRFCAMQSLIMCGGLIVLGVAVSITALMLAIIPLLGGVLGGVLHLAYMVCVGVFIWQQVVALIAAAKGELYKVPYIAPIAEKQLAK